MENKTLPIIGFDEECQVQTYNGETPLWSVGSFYRDSEGEVCFTLEPANEAAKWHRLLTINEGTEPNKP